MRLVVSGCDEADTKLALSNLNVPGASALLNPAYFVPDQEKLFIACGGPAVKQMQGMGWLPKKGGVEALRARLFPASPDGWSHQLNVGVTYDPNVMHVDYNKFVTMQTDLNLYKRFEQTGSMEPKLGHYTYADSLIGVVEYVKRKHDLTGKPVEIALDLETEGLFPWYPDKNIVCVQITAERGLTDVVYTLDMTEAQLDIVKWQLQWLVSCPFVKTIGANLKFDMGWLRAKWGIIVKNFSFDTCNAGSLLEENRSNTLNLQTKIYVPELGGYDDDFNRKYDKSRMDLVPKEALLTYAGGDTDACLGAYHAIRKELLADNVTHNGKPAKNSLASLYINIVHPTLKMLHRMEHNGVYVDVDKFHAFGSDLDGRMIETGQKAAEIIPKKLLDKHGGLNDDGSAPLSKPRLIADFLFSPEGLNLKPEMTTEKTGAPSTSEQHLSKFAEHPDARELIQLYLDYKSVSKMHGTYYEGFLKHLRPDNRWHPSYIIHKAGSGKDNESGAAGTVTGRGSATNPAFQCVAGDTLITTDRGVYTASELLDERFENRSNPFAHGGERVWTRKGWREASRSFRSWRHDVLKVELQCGVALACTPEHPILMRDGSWRKAGELSLGDEVAAPSRIERRKTPPGFTSEMLFALGVIVAVGRASLVNGTVCLEFPSRWATTFQELFHDFEMNPDICHADDMDRVFMELPSEAHWTPACARFLSVMPYGVHRLDPSLRGTEGAYDFVRGVIAATATVKRFTHSPCAELLIWDKRLADVLGHELMLDGIFPYPTVKRPFGVLFRYLGRVAAWIESKCGLGPDFWGACYGDLRLPNKPYRYNDRHTRPMAVKSVLPDEPRYVYDFTVPGLHEFQANGLTVHNTVPKHSYWGKRLRECIVAPEGYVIFGADYSQGELKVAACWAGEQKMIQAYKNGVDLHTLTAATVNGMTYEEAMFLKKNDEAAYKALRQNGKAGNFGLLYGMSAYGFMLYADAVYGVKLTLEEAEAMRDAFFNLYPGLPLWHQWQIEEARQTLQVRSPLGRVRHLPLIHSANKKIRAHTENQAINSPIQGTLVDMMWWSMALIDQERPEAIPFAQIHDQGLWYLPEDHVDEYGRAICHTMENLPFEEKFGWKPDLAFTVDAEVGLNLADLEEIEMRHAQG